VVEHLPVSIMPQVQTPVFQKQTNKNEQAKDAGHGGNMHSLSYFEAE
jgi:hypothetical protein